MCSTCDCDDIPKDLSNLQIDDAKRCRKCGADPYVKLDNIFIECKNCFLESCNRKVRSTIGKSKLMKNNDPIMIAHSGGASSTALLALIKSSIEFATRREQKFRPSILHIDTQILLNPLPGSTQADRLDRLRSILEDARGLYPDWPIYLTTIELSTFCSTTSSYTGPLYLRYENQDSLSGPNCDAILNNTDAARNLLLSLEKLDLTDKQQYVQKCIGDLINVIPSKISEFFEDEKDHFKFVFSGSSATQLANNLLVDVILGQGASIRSTVGVCDSRFAVPMVRPMRDFSKKEIAFYLKAKELRFHVQTNQATFADRKASIHKVTEAFLSKLYVNYPSTYNTLLKTGNKMQY